MVSLCLINRLSQDNANPKYDSYRNFITYYSAIVILQCPAGDPSNRSAVITDVVTVNTRVISLENNFGPNGSNRIQKKKIKVQLGTGMIQREKSW